MFIFAWIGKYSSMTLVLCCDKGILSFWVNFAKAKHFLDKLCRGWKSLFQPQIIAAGTVGPFSARLGALGWNTFAHLHICTNLIQRERERERESDFYLLKTISPDL